MTLELAEATGYAEAIVVARASPRGARPRFANFGCRNTSVRLPARAAGTPGRAMLKIKHSQRTHPRINHSITRTPRLATTASRARPARTPRRRPDTGCGRSQPLKMLRREGNALSNTLRQAWDGAEVLGTLTKPSPSQATGTHVSIIAQSTCR